MPFTNFFSDSENITEMLILCQPGKLRYYYIIILNAKLEYLKFVLYYIIINLLEDSQHQSSFSP